jgi:3-dehydroquinate dehydratase/shikimate dehydrogenase
MMDVYHYDEISEQTEVYGSIADPIGHGLGPQIFNAAFRHVDLNAVYIPFRVPREDLEPFVDDATALGIRGLAVAAPHREAIASKLTKVDPAVKGIGAVNTVVFRDADVVGYNTDCKAAMESLEHALREAGQPASFPKGRVVLLLGAGGVARAIAYGLRRRGAKTTVASRTRTAAEALARKHGVGAIDWATRHKLNANILINCTPIGMHPSVDEAAYDKHYLKPSMFVFDTVYNPETTLLVKNARSRSCHVVTGVEMFVRQACLQFKLFTGKDAPADLIRQVLKRAIGPVKY